MQEKEFMNQKVQDVSIFMQIHVYVTRTCFWPVDGVGDQQI